MIPIKVSTTTGVAADAYDDGDGDDDGAEQVGVGCAGAELVPRQHPLQLLDPRCPHHPLLHPHPSPGILVHCAILVACHFSGHLVAVSAFFFGLTNFF